MPLLPVVPIGDVVVVVNEYAGATRARAGEDEAAHPDLSLLVPGAAWAADLAPSTEQLVASADALLVVFTATPGPQRAEALDHLLRTSEVRPRWGQAEGLRWEAPDSSDALGAALAITVLTWAGEHGIEHLGTCAARRCTDVYADPDPRRRYCSTTCLNRTKVAAHRRRHAGATTPATGST